MQVGDVVHRHGRAVLFAAALVQAQALHVAIEDFGVLPLVGLIQADIIE